MSKSEVAAIVPIKIESRRLPNKNFLNLANRPLSDYIFRTLLESDSIGAIYAFSSNPDIVRLLPTGVHWLPRSPHLDGDVVEANELFLQAIERVEASIVLLAQIPGPFISTQTIDECVSAVASGNFDSSLTV